MSDTTDCDADAAPRTGRRVDPFGFDLDLDLDLDPDPASGPDADFALHGHVEEYDDAPDECTIFPRTASADLPRTTAWLTAEEGSYCSLDDAR